MIKIILIFCFFASLAINAQTYDFKTNQSLLTWTNSGGSNGVSVVSDGMAVSWIANKKPKVEITGASIDANTNKYLSITLINNSSEAVEMQVQHDANKAGTGERFYLIPGDLVTSLALPTTYVVDLTNVEWIGTMASVALAFRGAGNTNLANPSSSGDIIIQKIEFISEVPVKDTYLFNSGNYNEGWVLEDGVSNDINSGIMTIVPTVNGSTKINQKFFKLDPSVHSHIHITYKNESAANNQFRIQWISTGSTRKGSNIDISSNMSNFETVTYDLTGVKGTEWTAADATGFQIIIRDTNNSNNSSAGNLVIQSIVFNNSATPPSIFSAETDSDWATATNWSLNEIPTGASNVTIPTNTNTTIGASTAATVNNLDVDSAGSLTINGGGSLIVNGTSTGNVTYNRTLATNNWYLVASPVVGETAVDLISNAGDISNNGSEFAIGTYNDGWTYNYSATLGSGSGYAVKKDASGNLPFTGTIQTSDVASTTFDTTDDFNLFGNPYLSYIPANENADANNNFLTVNTASGQDELKEATIWFWDQATDGYIQINQASPARFIAPSQGFFIQNKGGFGDAFIDFKESMQSHQSTEVFNRSVNTRQDINLFLSDGTKNKYTEIYYIDGTTTGFDNGYDSSIFGGVTQEFAVYTEAVANGTGKKLGIQSLPNSELENMIIPVGVISDAGAVSFSVNASNLPQGYKVFLEDKDTGNFIRLDEAGSKYDVTFDNAVQGIGRFFLHTTTSALSTGSFDATNVSAYISEKNNLKIVGIQSGTTQVRLFNILGKQVLNTSFQSKGVDNVILPNVRTGVYIVQIVSEQGTINKKIVIE